MKEPEPQDFGITPEEYSLYAKNSALNGDPRRYILLVPMYVFVSFFVFIYLLSFGNWVKALWIAIAMTALSGIYVIIHIYTLVESAIVRFKKSRLLKRPVASQIKLYEEARAAYRKAHWEAERTQREAEKAKREAAKARQEAERARRRKLREH